MTKSLSPKRIRSAPLACVVLIFYFGSLPVAVATDKAFEPATSLVGVWAAQIEVTPQIEGTLIVERSNTLWQGQIAGHQSQIPTKAANAQPARVSREEVSLDFESQGAFRGFAQDGELQGHWIQPPSQVLGQGYATPIKFSGGPRIWIGEVYPAKDTLTLYLVLEKKEDGKVSGFLRNPERNIGLFARFGEVQQRDDQVQILDRKGQEIMFSGRALEGQENGRTLSLYLPRSDRTLDFKPLEELAGSRLARSFTPLPGSGASPAALTPPKDLGKGWPTADLATVELDPEPIRRLLEEIRSTPTESVFTPYLHSLLVARNGKLVVEEYFHGHHRELPHDTRSAGKSFATTLIGIAMDQNPSLNDETPVYSLLKARAGTLPKDSAGLSHNSIQLRHLLSMSSGLHCDDNDYETPGNEDNMQSQSEQPDWIRYAASLPMAWPPGSHDVYCSANMHLLAGILSEVTGQWVPEYFHQNLAEPLEFGRYHMNLDPAGEGYLGGGVRLRARDALKLGQVFLDRGRWKGTQIISEKWIGRAVAAHSSLNEPNDYGYGWWRAETPWQDRTVTTFYASGNGGQLVIVVPELDLVVAFQAANYSNYRVWRNFREKWLPEYILKSVAAKS